MTTAAPLPPAAPAGRRPLSQRTSQARQQQLSTIAMLLLLVGPLSLLAAACLLPLTRRPVARPDAPASPGPAWRTAMLSGLAMLGLLSIVLLRAHYLTTWSVVQATWTALTPLRPGAPEQLRDLALALWPYLWWWWRWSLPLAPALTLNLASLRVPSVEELEFERLGRAHRAEQQAVEAATKAAARAPEALRGALVLGASVGGGDLPWGDGPLVTFPAAELARHFILIGASGSGKSETALRIAAGAARYGWKVFIIDGKGEHALATRFVQVMHAVGKANVACFPARPYDGWQGGPTSLLNRLMAVADFSEPYYRDVTKLVLDLALRAPGGPPRTSGALLERMHPDQLRTCYQGHPALDQVAALNPRDVSAAHNRYRAFFGALARDADAGLPHTPSALPRSLLDGQGGAATWSFDTVDAGYLLLDGLALKDQTASLGRFLLEEFSHYAARRKPADERVLLIVDEFPAIAFGGANAASLFEMIRSYGVSIGITAQSYAAMGHDANRILGAAATLILHQCPDPEALLMRAGRTASLRRRVSFAERGMGTGARDFATGEGSLSVEREAKIDPDRVRALPAGQCVVIAAGRAQLVQVKRVASAADAGAGAAQTPTVGDAGSLLVRPAQRPPRTPIAVARPPAPPPASNGASSGATVSPLTGGGASFTAVPSPPASVEARRRAVLDDDDDDEVDEASERR